MQIEIFGISDKGKIRSLNEDSYIIQGFKNSESKGFCVLADGMGGHNAGEVASLMAIKTISSALKETLKSDKNIPGVIVKAVKSANSEIYKVADENEEQRGMGTTAVVCVIADDQLYIGNVGDSRAYLLRGDEILRITVDHSVVEELISIGSITREEAYSHPKRHVITRALGTDTDIEADIYEYTLKSGDTLILCSDGLTEMLKESEIRELTDRKEDIPNIVMSLVDKANENGGIDNITVIGARFS